MPKIPESYTAPHDISPNVTTVKILAGSRTAEKSSGQEVKFEIIRRKSQTEKSPDGPRRQLPVLMLQGGSEQPSRRCRQPWDCPGDRWEGLGDCWDGLGDPWEGLGNHWKSPDDPWEGLGHLSRGSHILPNNVDWIHKVF
jgi:hypothetical protein